VSRQAHRARQAKAISKYYFKPSHVDLVLGAAWPGGGPIDQSPDAVAALIEKTAVAMGAPFQTAAELLADAKHEVDKIVSKVEAMRQNGGMKEINRRLQKLSPGADGEGRKSLVLFSVHRAVHRGHGARRGDDGQDDLGGPMSQSCRTDLPRILVTH
jgi:hypothetical protein